MTILYKFFDKLWTYIWNLRYFIFSLLLIFSIFIIFIIILITFYLYKHLKQLFTKFCTGTYNLTEQGKTTFNTYKHGKIKRVFLIKHHINIFYNLFVHLTNILDYNVIPEYPKHCSIILELELPCNISKLLLIDKNPNVRLLDNFYLLSNTEYMSLDIKIPITLKKLITITKKNMGKKNFFSWKMKFTIFLLIILINILVKIPLT